MPSVYLRKRSASEMRRTQAEFQNINKAGKTLGKVIIKMHEMEDVLNENLVQPVRLFNAHVNKLIGSVTNLNNVMDYASKQFSDSTELTSAGLVDFHDVFLNSIEKLIHPIDKAGDDIIETGRMIRMATQEGLVSPMQLVGGNINDVSRSFNKFRNDLDDTGLDADAFATSREQNKMTLEFLNSQRRMGIQDDLNSESMMKSFSGQQSMLQLIAANTGATVSELSKEIAIEGKTFEEMATLGLFSAEQAKNLATIDASLRSRQNVAGSDFLRKVAESGGDLALFIKHNKDLWQLMQRTGNTSAFFETDAAVKAGDQKQIDTALKGFAGGFQEFMTAGSAAESTLRKRILEETNPEALTIMRQLSTQTNAMRGLDELPKKETVTSYYNKFIDFATNVFPLTAAAAVASLVTNTGALIALTMAVNANTASNFMGPMQPGGGGGTLKKLASIAGVAIKGIAKTATVGTAAVVTGKDALDLVVGGDTSASNSGALAGSAIGGTLGAVIGSIFPGIGTFYGGMAGAALGNMAGEFLGSKFESDDAATSPASLATPSLPTDSLISSPELLTGGGGRSVVDEKTLMINAKQAATLNSINSHMAESNHIQRGIRDRIGLNGNPGVGPAGRDASNNSSGGVVVAGPLGSK